MFDMTKKRIADYPLLHLSDEVRRICQPLETHFGVSSYVYFKLMPDGTKIQLGTDGAWMAHYYEQQYHLHSVFEKHPDEYNKGVVPWSALRTHDSILTDARDFGIYNGLTMINPVNDGCEFIFVGVNEDNQHLTAFHLNNLDVLEKFHQQFKEQAAGLIEKAYADPLYFPDAYARHYVTHEAVPMLQDSDRRHAMIDKLRQSAPIVLTVREYDIGRLLLQGMSMKEAARALDVSVRTVETHVAHIKEKCGLHFKGELIAKLRDIIVI
jgi:DNA-binding CsgD family transcriptional regulator